LTAYQLAVGQSVLGGDEFTAKGEVRLLGAHIGGQLVLDEARLTNRDGYSLNAEGLTVGKSTHCQGLTARGCVHLPAAQLGSHLDFRGASLKNPAGPALHLSGANATHLILRPAHAPETGVDLTNAQVNTFDDDQQTWPHLLLLRGFVYETLENDQINVRDRLRWLKLHPDRYIPQIYDQLATAYRRAGHPEAARKVGVAKQRRRRAFNPLNWLLYLTVGYGYRTWQAGIWLAGLAMLGSYVFTRAYPQHMVPATSKAPAFHAFAYTLDVLLPIGDLGQEKAWIPQGWARNWAWFLIGAGWFLTTAAVAGLTGIFKRD
jgi:hypothetical protein